MEIVTQKRKVRRVLLFLTGFTGLTGFVLRSDGNRYVVFRRNHVNTVKKDKVHYTNHPYWQCYYRYPENHGFLRTLHLCVKLSNSTVIIDTAKKYGDSLP